MKKLVYILSIAIGLFVTGCAQWEDFESQASDTWGATPELVVSLDSTCLDEAGNLTKDYLPLTFTTKNATHMGYVVSLEPVEVDYTALLGGLYGNYVADTDSAGWELKQNLSGVQPGNTYYIYAVAANGAGIQATVAVAVGAVDVDAPQPLTNPQLKATQGGKRAVIAFNENIIRDENMGAISYVVYNAETNELFDQGVVADATAAGANLTVTLPETVAFAEDAYYIVVLSFAEGAVTDLYGNKMAAIEGVYNVDEMTVDNGYWWLVEPKGSAPEGFFREGAYAWSFQLTTDGENYQAFNYPTEFTYESAGFDMGQIFNGYDGVLANRWAISGFLGLFQGAAEQDFPAFTYEDEIEGDTYECMTIIDADNLNTGGLVCVGTMTFSDGATMEVYWGEMTSDGQLYTNLEFLVVEGEACYAGNTPVLFVLEGGKPALLALYSDLVLTYSEGFKAGSAVYYEEPVELDVHYIGYGDYKSVMLQK